MMRNGKTVWLAAGAVAMLALGVWVWFFFRSSSNESIRPDAPISTFPEGRRPVNLPISFLFDCYDSGWENVPPMWNRDPRIRNWTPPPAPLPLLKAALDGSEPQLLQWFEQWEAQAGRGAVRSPAELDQLSSLLENTSLSFDALFKIGLAVSFLDGDVHAARWYRAAIARAERECRGLSPGDPRARAVLDALWQMASLWRVDDRATLLRRFTLERALSAPRSPEARRAGYLMAQTMTMLGQYAQAADLMLQVRAEHEQAGDLSKFDQDRLLSELGSCCDRAGRYDLAVKYFQQCIQLGGSRAQTAPGGLVWALIHANRLDEAEQVYQRSSQDRTVPPYTLATMKFALDGAKRRSTPQTQPVSGN